MFGKEFAAMLRLRGLFERLSNEDADRMMRVFSESRLQERMASTDFDFHATALISALGVAGILRLAKVLVSVETRKLLSSLS